MRDIEHTRAELGSNLQELEAKVKGVTNWRRQFDKSPFAMIGVAFGGGILLATALGGSSRHSFSRGRWKWPFESAAGTRPGAFRQMWVTIKGAFIGVAAGKVPELLIKSFRGSSRISKRFRNAITLN